MRWKVHWTGLMAKHCGRKTSKFEGVEKEQSNKKYKR